ncbi:MAG: EVE domain-containing protein [Ferruginibacter sp.]
MDKWLIKSEPTVYSWEKLMMEKKTTWDGVRNFAARNFLRSMKKNDLLFFYHSNTGMEIMGIAKVIKPAYPDPSGMGKDWVVIDIAPIRKLRKTVPLSIIKNEKRLNKMALVRLSRLSVQPVTDEEWEIVLTLAGENNAT